MCTLLKSMFLFFICCGALYAADNYLETIDKASMWIDKKYTHQRTKNAANRELDKIVNSEIGQAEIIQKIKKAFPEAFQIDEKPLIYLPPISWRIHSLSLGYDIQENASQTTKEVNISKEVANKSVSKNIMIKNY